MKRRTLLAAAAAGTAGFAGCLASGNGDDDGNESAGGDGIPAVENSEIETTDTGCGSADTGSATAERGDGTVTVEGAIGASTPCHEAVLQDVAIHNRQLVLRVGVEDDGSGACTTCIGVIDYEATVSVSNVGGLHGTTVEHVDGDEHATNWDESGRSTP